MDRGFERNSVLAVAYNKKAQLELEERCAGHRLLGSPRMLDERDVRRLIDGGWCQSARPGQTPTPSRPIWRA